MAISEQVYSPLSLGGSGHQESSALFIAKTENPKKYISFHEHADEIKKKNDDKKSISFVSFSEDEKRIMSLSKDGVVLVRNIDLDFLNTTLQT